MHRVLVPRLSAARGWIPPHLSTTFTLSRLRSRSDALRCLAGHCAGGRTVWERDEGEYTMLPNVYAILQNAVLPFHGAHSFGLHR